VKELLDTGCTNLELWETHFGSCVKYFKSFYEYKNVRTSRIRTSKTELHIRWGVPGTAKSDWPLRHYGTNNVYEVPRPQGSSQWFDGYLGQQVALLDDFYGWIPLHFLLKLADGTPLRVPIKGGFTHWAPKKLFITSNKPWEDWYDWNKEGLAPLKPALERRITSCTEFTWFQVYTGPSVDLPSEGPGMEEFAG